MFEIYYITCCNLFNLLPGIHLYTYLKSFSEKQRKTDKHKGSLHRVVEKVRYLFLQIP